MNQNNQTDIFSCGPLRLESTWWHHHVPLRPPAFSLQAVGDAPKQRGKHGRRLHRVKILGKNKGSPPPPSPTSVPFLKSVPQPFAQKWSFKATVGEFCYSAWRKRYQWRWVQKNHHDKCPRRISSVCVACVSCVRATLPLSQCFIFVLSISFPAACIMALYGDRRYKGKWAGGEEMVHPLDSHLDGQWLVVWVWPPQM